jgi:hypothetical protein
VHLEGARALTQTYSRASDRLDPGTQTRLIPNIIPFFFFIIILQA